MSSEDPSNNDPSGTGEQRRSQVRLVDSARKHHGQAAERRPTTHAHEHDADADETRSTSHEHAHETRPTSDEHEHEHAHAHARFATLPGAFPHEKLDAYRVALELAGVAKKVASQIPRGHRSIADHLLRASSNAVLLIAEGANRRGAAEKRQRFVESRGECAEAAAAADLVVVLELAASADAEELKHLAGRVSAMLTGLIARLG